MKHTRLKLGLTLLLSSTTLFGGCAEETQCARLACNHDLNLELVTIDARGVYDATGTLTIGEDTYSLSCPGQGVAPSDAQSPYVIYCETNVINIPQLAIEKPAITAQLTSEETGYSYDGPITPQFATVEDFNGEGCGSCSYGIGAVFFQ